MALGQDDAFVCVRDWLDARSIRKMPTKPATMPILKATTQLARNLLSMTRTKPLGTLLACGLVLAPASTMANEIAPHSSAERGLASARDGTPCLDFDLASAWSAEPVAVSWSSAIEPIQSSSPAIDPLPPVTEDWAAVMRHRGYHFRASGLLVEPQNDGRLDDGSSIEMDTGGGVALAVGYRFVGMPLTFDLEYAFRSVDADGDGYRGDGSVRLHTITFNTTLDATELIGPVGVYAGVGVGVRIDEFRFSSSGIEGGGSETEINGSGFYWQARAGLTVSLGDSAQLFGGVVWSDAGVLDDEDLRVDAEMLAAELGVRFFF